MSEQGFPLSEFLPNPSMFFVCTLLTYRSGVSVWVHSLTTSSSPSSHLNLRHKIGSGSTYVASNFHSHFYFELHNHIPLFFQDETTSRNHKINSLQGYIAHMRKVKQGQQRGGKKQNRRSHFEGFPLCTPLNFIA